MQSMATRTTLIHSVQRLCVRRARESCSNCKAITFKIPDSCDLGIGRDRPLLLLLLLVVVDPIHHIQWIHGTA